jgi:hypothetical protein
MPPQYGGIFFSCDLNRKFAYILSINLNRYENFNGMSWKYLPFTNC